MTRTNSRTDRQTDRFRGSQTQRETGRDTAIWRQGQTCEQADELTWKYIKCKYINSGTGMVPTAPINNPHTRRHVPQRTPGNQSTIHTHVDMFPSAHRETNQQSTHTSTCSPAHTRKPTCTLLKHGYSTYTARDTRVRTMARFFMTTSFNSLLWDLWLRDTLNTPDTARNKNRELEQ